MTIGTVVNQRGIAEILHFTTNKGILGILDANALKARQRLTHDERLEYIFAPNAASRNWDLVWLDYVNLSISRINSQFFNVSAGSWHRFKDIWWCILSFSPEILEHAGVQFSTTNNVYPSTLRAPGASGLRALFANQVSGRYGAITRRTNALPSHYTTCEQAEVLYPGQVDTAFLQAIYVRDEESADELAGQVSAVSHTPVRIEIAPQYFEPIS